ncbi:MAG: hypothetical protein A2538_03760 [Candidatus Magasanikbacteria bacterium RIFOXYD2_FULL_41_14]|uniref:Glycosyltransferase subfamily 4-like N-terminal domain-containing protein n=1 Tax=Candidatus Magasanikbacteria bacterium RIFOXYD2_FULL_41_14 TaxID=1798709 RepID=A0A1F6PCR0_9BACT|nr:MAG: hypothetical protein A2538_03760 [Candidatus Magasanikbacteria bacterium RIFOXYD2_FULL_41_14]
MKVAHLVSTFYPRVGGMGEICRQEAELLSLHDINVSVFTLLYPGKIKKMENSLYSIKRLRPLFRLSDGGEVPQLLWKLREFDIVHLHYPFYGAQEWVWLSRLISKKPYVVTYHMDADSSGFIYKKIQSVYDKIWAGRVLGGAKKIIAIDRAHFDNTRYGKCCRPDSVEEVFNAVNSDIFHPTGASWANLGLPELVGRQTLLFVGNFLPFKRFDLLCEALAMLPKEMALVAVGDGYCRDEYRAKIKSMGLASRVTFYGRCVNKNKLADLYSAADCLVVPSDRAESFSLTALESQACGTPVIATNIPGVRGRIEDGCDGFLFASGDKFDMAKKISTFFALSPEERALMGKSGRSKILSKYSWDDHIKKLITIYHEVLA